MALFRIPTIVIFGATACGKSNLAVSLFGKSAPSQLAGCAEAINADSVQIYRWLDIGSAKPTPDDFRELPHHCVDFLSPDQDFSVAKFVKMADDAAGEIFARGKIPLLIGGTAFYIKNFLFGLPQTPTADLNLRKKLQNDLQKFGKEAMLERLKRVDAKSAVKIHPNDEYRILRALEVFEATGKPLSQFTLAQTLRPQYEFLCIHLTRSRKDINARIDERVEKMFAAGLPDEVKMLVDKGFSGNASAMSAIGYREFFDADGNFSPGNLDAIKDAIKSNSKKYAKRQETFFRSIKNAIQVDADDRKTAECLCVEFLEKTRRRNAKDGGKNGT